MIQIIIKNSGITIVFLPLNLENQIIKGCSSCIHSKITYIFSKSHCLNIYMIELLKKSEIIHYSSFNFH